MKKPTTKQQEILDLIQEECGEIIQAISKIRRFGLDSKFSDFDNHEILCRELEDFTLLKELLFDSLVGNLEQVIDTKHYKFTKNTKLYKYTNIFDEEPK